MRKSTEQIALQAAADTARLDWLIKQGPPGAATEMGLTEESWESAAALVGAERGDTDAELVRAAIDDAMKRE